VVIAIDANKNHVGSVEYDKESDLRARPEAWTAREVVLLAATLAARDERVRELEAEVAEWQSRAKELLEDGCRGSDLNTRLCEQIAGLDAEVAALREVAGLVREWQAAKRAEDETLGSSVGGAFKAAISVTNAIESSLLAAALPEASHG
jgi:hypothetical protein